MACLSYSKKLDNLCAPTRKVIDLFKHQRKRQQFAVVYLSPYSLEHISDKNLTFSTQDSDVDTPDEATDSSLQPSFPGEYNRYNFIAARPTRSGKCHSEEMLMNGFECLLDSYEFLETCRSVVIYSWFHPCYDCAYKIVDTLGHHIAKRDMEVAVVYSRVLSNLDADTRESIQWLFTGCGIKLKRVKSRS